MLLLMGFAFLAGIVTILSPCILPILPIVLTGSIDSSKKKPLGIVTGFIASFTFFTLFLSAIVKATNLPADSLRFFAIATVFLFGLFLLIPQTQALLEKLLSSLSSKGPRLDKHPGFLGGVLIGLSLGLVWAPCVGPILASVITLAATSTITASAFFITLAYSLGTAIPMFIIMYSGQNVLRRVPWLLANTATIQKVFGIVMIATALGLYFNIDRKFQTHILEKFPQYGSGLISFEDNITVQKQLEKLQPTQNKKSVSNQKAPDFTGGGEWLNSEPLSLQGELKGKVVLVDFWTYSCINCIRTFPYLKSWYEKYKDQGFVIVGVHSPEFEFEKKTENVAKALSDYGLQYPVVLDNDFKIWSAYKNRYWPAHYLIDKDGVIQYTHFGEGKYIETENEIRRLLEQDELSETDESKTSNRKRTPETYLGYSRAESYLPELAIAIDSTKTYSHRATVLVDGVGLTGSWSVGPEAAQAQGADSSLTLQFLAQDVHLVLTPPQSGSGKVRVFLDGQPLPAQYQTNDTDENGVITVDQARIYDLLDLKQDYGEHELRLQFESGISAFAFTFGS